MATAAGLKQIVALCTAMDGDSSAISTEMLYFRDPNFNAPKRQSLRHVSQLFEDLLECDFVHIAVPLLRGELCAPPYVLDVWLR